MIVTILSTVVKKQSPIHNPIKCQVHLDQISIDLITANRTMKLLTQIVRQLHMSYNFL